MTLARRRLAAFARVVREDFVTEWFHGRVLGPALDMIVRHARGYDDGLRRLVLEMPQQEGKTLFTCLMSASLLGQEPDFTVQDIGYGDEFIKMCAAYVSEIGASDGWADVYPDVSLGEPSPERRRGAAVDRKATDTAHQIDVLVRSRRGGWKRSGGSFRARSVKGPVGGRPGRVMILEDPYKGWDGDAGALSPTWNRHLANFYGAVFKTRQQDMRSCEILAFTPFTDDDIRMNAIDRWCRSGGPFLWLRLPSKQRHDRDTERAALLARDPAIRGLAKFLGVDAAALRAAIAGGGPLRPYDAREVGAGLSPRRRGQDFYDMLYAEAEAVPRDLAALLELCPQSDLVDRFPLEHWVPWDPAIVPVDDMSLLITVDPNGDATSAGSFCSVGVHGYRRRPDRGPGRYPWLGYRVDERRGRPGYTDFCDMVAGAAAKWPEARTLRIERTGHGRSAATDATFLARPELRGREVQFVDPDNGRSKEQHWSVVEVPHKQRCLHVPVAPSEDGRVTTRWLHDDPDAGAGEDDGAGVGYLSEMKRAGRWRYNDRCDDTALFVDYLDEHGEADQVVAEVAAMRFPGYSLLSGD